eukprot:4005838-Pleurochrysis_carterae.AAC.1
MYSFARLFPEQRWCIFAVLQPLTLVEAEDRETSPHLRKVYTDTLTDSLASVKFDSTARRTVASSALGLAWRACIARDHGPAFQHKFDVTAKTWRNKVGVEAHNESRS